MTNKTTSATASRSVLVLGDKSRGIAAGSGLLNPQGSFTIEAWISPSSSSKIQVILAEGANLFYLEGSDLKFRSNATAQPITSDNAGLMAGKWYHVAVVWRDSRSGETKLYINGNQNDNQVAVPAITTTGAIYLGADPANAKSGFRGKLLEIRVWRYARSQSELQANMAYFLTGRELGLVRCWSLQEGFGTVIGDKTTNRAKGTIVGNSFTWEQTEIPIKVNLSAQELLTRSTGLEDYGYWFMKMAEQSKQRQNATPLGFRRGRIWS